MAAPRFTVKYQDGKSLQVRVMPKAQVLFERRFSTSMSKFANDPSAEQGYYLAWAALHCAGMEGKDFEEFLDVIEEIEHEDSEETPDPTKTAPGPEPSSS